jgi:hypothetical protein
MIFGPGTYVVEFRTAEGDVLAISIPRTEAVDQLGQRKNCAATAGTAIRLLSLGLAGWWPGNRKEALAPPWISLLKT